ncbi:photoreceptor-specific nuclear receptor-like [Dendronephthya gigantea]|uniref:photoreceptor-specific nuclear receptor-like n=1 Tax=Dendronephthya gigantea TaxID=151771 RepID=UPI00106DB0B5|nr:photoreceptor-specific nuclear receptor-like [Dendronephthya gigantea]
MDKHLVGERFNGYTTKEGRKFRHEHNLGKAAGYKCFKIDTPNEKCCSNTDRGRMKRFLPVSHSAEKDFSSMEKNKVKDMGHFSHIALRHQRFPHICQADPAAIAKLASLTPSRSERRRNLSTNEPAETHIETASRWLFMSIKWAKSLPYFAELYYPDQLELLRQNWSRLFLFNLMYFEMVPKASAAEDDVSGALRDVFVRWSEANQKPEIPGKIEYSLEKIRRLHMDETETLLVKSLLLFNPETEGLVDASQVQVTQNKCHRALEEHALSSNPGERDRSGRILLTILTLSTFEERDVEAMFLSTVLGNATVTSLMENILCADAM